MGYRKLKKRLVALERIVQRLIATIALLKPKKSAPSKSRKRT